MEQKKSEKADLENKKAIFFSNRLGCYIRINFTGI